ncbi:MAG: cytochrome c [Rhizobacter sp.]|nr:cytochrome c [Rhizobacter sp.]
MRAAGRVAAATLGLAVLLGATVWWLNVRDDERPATAGVAQVTVPSVEQVARGAYLARAGNCMGCHTATGGAPYAGGRGVPTPFGPVFAPNLTPDANTGIGAWSSADFWRALHHGRSRDGRLLYPAFPYPNYTRVTREDADALHAYLRSLPAVAQPNRAHELRFPFDQQAALAVWRALYFRAALHTPDATRSAEWNRGAYLVEALGHCNACHASRNALGATASPLDLAGGLIPVQNWYAPSLTSAREASVAAWDLPDITALLKTGVAAPHGALVAVAGPMSEVVTGSTQHLTDADLRAMAAYLKALPQTTQPGEHSATTAPGQAANASAAAALTGPGAKRYEQYCAQCHGERGEGVAAIYPALAGNRAVAMHTPANAVHMVVEGGFAPATAGNPRPFGMPPFATVLNDEEVAQVLTFVRGSWGNAAPAVTALEVSRYRGAR